MVRIYSRLKRVEERKNIRRAFVYLLLTTTTIALFIFYGIPTVAKFATFLANINSSNVPVEKNDQTPPIVPKVDVLPEATNQAHVELKGSTEPGATVTISINNKEDSTLADKSGNFTFSISLRDGINTIYLFSEDNAKNKSQKTDTYKIIFDNEPPDLEIIKPENGSQFYGSKQRQVIIEGQTEEQARININDRIIVVENDGKFSYLTTLSEGENNFTIKAEDKAGNTTEKSITLHFSS